MASLVDVPITFGLVARTIGILVLFAVLKFFYRLYQVRSLVRKAAKENGVKFLPHSFLLGHLPVVARLMAKYPLDTSGQYVPLLLAKEYPEICNCGLVYVDTWPIAPPMVAVFHPDMMSQFTQETSLPKHDMLHKEFMPFTQCKDLVNLEGQEWKAWRSIFNPGFSAKNLLSFVPAILEEVHVFRAWLKSVAKSGEVVKLEEQAMKVTIDVIGRAVLDTRLHCQTRTNRFYNVMKNQISWLLVDNTPSTIRKTINPFRPLMTWNNNRIIKNFLQPHIERSIARHGTPIKGPQTITDLAIKSYVTEVQPVSQSSNANALFINQTIEHLKIFIFAGHDTTASTLSFAFHLLHTNPATLATLRAEHDAVFGTNPSTASDTITASPQLLNQLPYTSAVIKETLRLFPPVGTVRRGSASFYLTHPETGTRYATDGLMLYGCSMAEHRLDAFWPRAAEFVPERWLAREGDPLHVRKNAFRPFELGPRNCIGQELAQLELRAILAMTIREVDVCSVYPADGTMVLGELAYQCMVPGAVTGHPKGMMPVTVQLRE